MVCPKCDGKLCKDLLSGMASIKLSALAALKFIAFLRTAILISCWVLAAFSAVDALVIPEISIIIP